MQNPCSKKLCKKHDKTSQMEPKREPESIANQEKTRSGNRCEKRGACPEGRRLVRAPLLRLNHLFSTRFRLRLVISSRLVFVFVSSSSSRRLLSSFDIPYRLLFVPSLSSQRSKTSLCQIADRSVAKANDATHIVRRVLRM